MKRCIKCGETKPENKFIKDKNRPDGLFPYCKRCRWVDPEKREFLNRQKELGFIHCADCDRWLTRDKFYDNAGCSRGHSSQCIECMNNRWNLYNQEHGDQIVKKRKEFYQKNKDRLMPANRNRLRKNAKRYAENRNKKYWENHDEVLKKAAENRRNNPERFIVYSQNRRSRKKRVGGKITEWQWKEMLALFGNCCLCCGAMGIKLEMDHIIPLDPGTHTVDNVQPLCRSCNAKKHRKVIDYRTPELRDMLDSRRAMWEEMTGEEWQPHKR